MSAALSAYEAALGMGAVAPCRVDLDGLVLERCIEPRDGDALARAVAALHEHDLAAVVRGRGTLDHFGNVPARGDLLLSTKRLVGVEELAADEGVVRVKAGTPVAELQATVAAEGWTVPLDPPGDASVGGTLAAASAGPLALGHGPPRDAVLGLDVVLPSGERTRCGGRVVKNVTGYDLGRLYTGAFGSLGVIEAAWLRMRPRPERVVATVRELEGELGDVTSAVGECLAVARRGSACCAALLSPGAARRVGVEGDGAAGPWTLFAAFAGFAPEVEEDIEASGGSGARSSRSVDDAEGAIARLRSFQLPPRDAHAEVGASLLSARIAVEPLSMPQALSILCRTDAEVVAHVGLGTIHLRFDALADDAALERGLAAIDRAARGAGGHVRLEALPTAVKRGRDVFGELGDTARVQRAIKERFDPAGRLNPGRYAGHL